MVRSILQQIPTPASLAALREVHNDIGGHTSHIAELAALLQDQAGVEGNSQRIDALAEAIILMAHHIDETLERHLAAAAVGGDQQRGALA